MTKIKLNDLKKLGKDINAQDVFEEQINVKANQEELEEKIFEAIGMMDDEELGGLSEDSTETLEALKANKETSEDAPPPVKKETKKETKKESKKEVDENAENNIEYIKEIMEDCEDVKELHTLVKQNSCFKSIRSGIHLQKNIEKVTHKMNTCLKEWKKSNKKDAAAKTEKKAEKKAEKKTAEKATEKKEPHRAFNRVEAACIALKRKPKTFDKWVEMTDAVMLENDAKENPQESRAMCRKVVSMSKQIDIDHKVPVE